jgi:hypothetical protein
LEYVGLSVLDEASPECAKSERVKSVELDRPVATRAQAREAFFHGGGRHRPRLRERSRRLLVGSHRWTMALGEVFLASTVIRSATAP